MKYEDLTQEQIDEICNGCGGKGGYVKPPHALLFRPDCNQHDYQYYIGCTWWHRLKADWMLRSLMRTRIKNTNAVALRDHLYIEDKYLPDFMVRQIFYRWADLYCAGVMAAGWQFFYFGNKKRYPTG